MIALVYYACTLLAVIAGAKRAGRAQPDVPTLIVILVAVTLTAATLFSERHSGTSSQHTVVGVISGSVGFVAIPALGYYALGRKLAGRAKLLATIWVASLIPFSIYLGLLLLIVAGNLSCAPAAYECPV